MACIDICQIAMTVPALLGNSQQPFMGYLGYSKKKLGKPPGAGECSLLVIEFLDGIEGCTWIELTEDAEGCWLGKIIMAIEPPDHSRQLFPILEPTDAANKASTRSSSFFRLTSEA
jgi:hypothetical protein